MLEPILYFSGMILATLVVAAFVCRYRVSYQKKVSWGTVLASSVIANVGVFFGLAFYEDGFHIFTREAWSGGKGGWEDAVFVCGVITVMCILPALGVAVCYQRRSKRAEKQVA